MSQSTKPSLADNYSNGDHYFSNKTLLDAETNDDEFRVSKLFIIIVYTFLSLGVLFNCVVAGTIVNIFVTLRQSLTNRHTYVYILALSLVDACVLSNVPLIIADIMLNSWQAGLILCKIYWTVDSVNKVLSTFVLTALSFDRYLAICKSNYPFPHWRSVRTSVCVVTLCLLAALALLYPCYAYSEISDIPIPTTLEANFTIRKCSIKWTENEERVFVHYIFAVGYCLPLGFMAFFHGSIIATLWRNDKRMRHVRKNAGQTQQVVKRTTFLVVFYFLCWTPYWVTVFYIRNAPPRLTYDNNWIPIAVLSMHILVYLNSAVNPFLYAMLNTELRRQHYKAQEVNNRRSQQHETTTALLKPENYSKTLTTASTIVSNNHVYNA